MNTSNELLRSGGPFRAPQYIVRQSDAFPERLRLGAAPPSGIFLVGEALNLEGRPCIGIVGSRRADVEACEVARRFGSELTQMGAIIVSGLAIGIDGAAHEGALSVPRAVLPTIAVLGNGFPHIYPARHGKLAERIVERGGAIISQFPINEPAYPGNFLQRNAVIAALSDVLIVIQASKRSGSLVTARHALDLGKDIFIVPGSITDDRYSGSNELIKHGAYLLTSSTDLFGVVEGLKELNEDGPDLDLSNFPEDQRSILSKLVEEGRMHIEKLSEESLSGGDLELILVELELSGVIERLPGNYLKIRSKLT